MSPSDPSARRALAISEVLLVAALAWAALSYGGLGHYVWTVAPSWCLAAGAAGLALWARARCGAGGRGDRLALALALVWLLWAALVPLPPHNAYRRAIRLLQMGGLVGIGYAAWVIASASRRARRRLLGMAALLGALEATLALLQVANLIPGIGPDGAGTASGSFLNRNLLAGFFEVTLFAAAAQALDKGLAKNRRVLFGTAVLLMVTASGVVASRGGWISLALGAVVFAGFARVFAGDKRPALAIGGAVLLGGAVTLGASRDVVLARAETLGALLQTEQDRQDLWRAAWEMSRDHPLVGVGVGNFKTYFALYRPRGAFGVRWYPVQDYLQTSAEGGFPALLLLLALMGLAAHRLSRQAREGSRPRRALHAQAGLASLVALAAHGFVDLNFRSFATVGTLLLVVMATLAAGDRNEGDPTEEDATEGKVGHSNGPAQRARASALLAGLLPLVTVGVAARLLAHDRDARAATRANERRKDPETIAYTRAAITVTASNPYPWLLLADAWSRSAVGQGPAQAREYLDLAARAAGVYRSMVPTESPIQIILARIARHRADLGAGPTGRDLAILQAASRRYPNDPEILVRLGQALLEAGRAEEGYARLREGFAGYPEPVFRRRHLAPVAGGGDALLALAPAMPEKSVAGWSMLAAEFVRRGHPREALQCWHRAIAADPADPGPRLGAVAVLIGAGELARARESLSGVEPLLETPSDVYLRLLHRAQESPQDALAVARGAVSRFPQDPAWAAQLVRDLSATGAEEEAHALAAQATARFEEAPEPWTAQGEILERRGREREDLPSLRDACASYREALLRKGDSSLAAERLAALYVSLEEEGRAEPVLVQLLDAGVISAAGRVRLARIWLGLGRPDGARRLLEPLGPELDGLVVDGKPVRDLRTALGPGDPARPESPGTPAPPGTPGAPEAPAVPQAP